MDREDLVSKNRKKIKIKTILFSVLVSFILFFSIESLESYKFSKSNESKFLIENIDIEYLYDSENYEVSSVVNNPYAIVRGDSSKVNLLKLKNNFKFYIDLEGAEEGIYDLNVLYEGIDKDLEVEIYPRIVKVSLIEKEIVGYEPNIEIIGDDKLNDNNLIVGIPEILNLDKVNIRETQSNLGKIGSVKGIIDVSDYNETFKSKVKLYVYDREGNKMENINLIDDEVEIEVPIINKVTIENKVIEEIIVEEVIEQIIVNSDDKEKLLELSLTLESLKTELSDKKKEIEDKKSILLKNDKTIKSLEDEIENLRIKLEELEELENMINPDKDKDEDDKDGEKGEND